MRFRAIALLLLPCLISSPSGAATCTSDGTLCVGDPTYMRSGSTAVLGTVTDIKPDGALTVRASNFTVTSPVRDDFSSTHPDVCIETDQGRICAGDSARVNDQPAEVKAILPDGQAVVSIAGADPSFFTFPGTGRTEEEKIEILLGAFGKLARLARMEPPCATCEGPPQPAQASPLEVELARRIFQQTPYYRQLLEEKKLSLEELLKKAIAARPKLVVPQGKLLPPPKPVKGKKAPAAPKRLPPTEAQKAAAAFEQKKGIYRVVAQTILDELQKDGNSPAGPAPADASSETCFSSARTPEKLDDCLNKAASAAALTAAVSHGAVAVRTAKLPAPTESQALQGYRDCLGALPALSPSAVSTCLKKTEKAVRAAKLEALLGEHDRTALRETLEAPALKALLTGDEKAMAARLTELRDPGLTACLEAAVQKEVGTPDIQSCARKAKVHLRSTLLTQQAGKKLQEGAGQLDAKASIRIPSTTENTYRPCVQKLLEADPSNLDDRQCVDAAIKKLKNPLSPDSLERPTSFARLLLDNPDLYSFMLSTPCQKFLTDLYKAGKTLYSDVAYSKSKTITQYPFKTGGIRTDFFHHSRSTAVLDQLHPKERDREKAHELSIRRQTYENIFRWWRERSSKSLYDRVIYVAEDPDSSYGSYGKHRVVFHLHPETRVLYQNYLPRPNDIYEDVDRKHPGLLAACSNANGGDPDDRTLRYFIYEDTGIDLIDHGGGGAPRERQWFQLVRPTPIQRTEVEY